MKVQKYLAFAMIPLFAATAVADVEDEREMKIVVAGAVTGDHETIHWTTTGAPGLDMHSMQVGETQSFIDDTGRSVLVTREENGFRFDVDGKTVNVPAPGVAGDYLTLTGATDATAVFDVEIVGDHPPPPFPPPPMFYGVSGVTIISDEPLDAATQESIRAVLISVGRDDEVTFVDRSKGFAGGRVHAIRETVEIEQ